MAQDKEAANSSKEMEEKMKVEREKKKKENEKKKKEECRPFNFPYNVPVCRSSATTIERFSESLQRFGNCRFSCNPAAPVAIGPYHHGSPHLQEMEGIKRAALEEFRKGASEQCEAVQRKILSLVESARSCYAGERYSNSKHHSNFADMMFLDGWFLLQFMVSMCPDDPDAPPEADLLMSRAEVHTRIDDIARDVLLLENQVPWLVLESLMELWPAVPVDRFLRLMASAFVIGNEDDIISDNPTTDLLHDEQPAPPHLLGLFYRRQVGVARTRSLRVPRLSSLSSTVLELTEMGVKLTASKTNMFGDMSMSKRRPSLGLSGELSLALLVLNNLTSCWLINMAAYEECLGATHADNFTVSSYISVLALLMNRKEDMQELRAKGIINSAFCDKSDTLLLQ
jgi:hypothetical protein